MMVVSTIFSTVDSFQSQTWDDDLNGTWHCLVSVVVSFFGGEGIRWKWGRQLGLPSLFANFMKNLPGIKGSNEKCFTVFCSIAISIIIVNNL